MSKILDLEESAYLRQEIISQCTWSDTYSSLKYILKRTAYQLPLLVSFPLNTSNHDEQETNNIFTQTILFFDRNLSKKIFLTPLQQRDDQPDQFNVYPNHCTFVMTDSFKGLFEFVLNGQRCSQIYHNLDQLIASSSMTTTTTSPLVFMSRDRAIAFFQDSNVSNWSNKEYRRGAIFRAERIHRSSTSTIDGQSTPNDYLECLDEDGYSVFLKMDQTGRYTQIATSTDQQANHPEYYLHSSQTPNIEQLIKRLTSNSGNIANNNCIRLVRGPVPHNFYCQYFHFFRQHTHDIVVGITQEGLLIEWNLDSHVPCRYSTNLNEILNNLSGTTLEQTLETYIEQARLNYKDNFQNSMQLISSQDWTAFFQYWKWIGDSRRQNRSENQITYQSRSRFHLVASIQDLSDHSDTLISSFKNFRDHSFNSPPLKENKLHRRKKTFSSNQLSFLSQMSKLLASPSQSRRHHINQSSQQIPRASILGMPNGVKPFDDSIYDSNQIRQSPSKENVLHRSTRRT